MIISRGRRYIFVHIPKTGGTAMALALEARAKADDILIGDTPKAVKRRRRLKAVAAAGRLWKHSTLRDAEGLISRDDMQTLFVVTLVRNPWDRMVSYYTWLREQRFDHPMVVLAKALSFEAFVLHDQVAAALRAAPYGSYVTDADGEDRANLYIRLEQFAEDVAPFEAHLGFPVDMPVANRSDRQADYRGYYGEATRAAVATYAAEDIARFGYVFE